MPHIRELHDHVRTDPACLRFREPRTWLGRWVFDRNRGLACPICTEWRDVLRREGLL